MVIHHSGTFDYEADFTEESFGKSEILLQGTDTTGRDADRLVGLRPKLRFSEDRLVVFTSEKHRASVRHASCLIGDAVNLTARPNDRLYLSRTGTGDIGLSVLRQQNLIIAIGAVTAVPLGGELQVVHRSEGNWKMPSTKTWLEFRAGGRHLGLRGREFSEIGDFHVYVERCWEFGIPGTGECVSVCVGDDQAIRIATIRSAVLIRNHVLKLVQWDNTEKIIQQRRA